jgi:hypothetical protein
MNTSNSRINYREDPRQIELIEEVLHHVQLRIPGFEDRFPYPGEELHVKDFMIRHRAFFGITPDDVGHLQQMLRNQMYSNVDRDGNPLVLPPSADLDIRDYLPPTGHAPFLSGTADAILEMMQDEIDNGLRSNTWTTASGSGQR